MKKIILFTKLYPYGKTEAFLETEIDVLSKYIKEIIVCPAYTDSFLREVPPNVMVDTTFAVSKKKQIACTFSSIIKGTFFKYLSDHISKIESIQDIANLLRYSAYEIFYDRIYSKNKVKLAFEASTVIYSYWFSHIVNSLLRLNEKYKLECKVISRAHRWDVYEDGALFPYRQKSINNLIAIFPISEDAKLYIQKRYGNDDRIIVSRLGVLDKGLMSVPSPTDSNRFVVVSVSQITHRKRIFLLFESVKQYAIQNKEKECHWIHFGTGELEYDLKNKITQTKCPNLTVELKGYVQNSQIYTFYKSETVDVFVNLSESEGVPVSIMEAQSFGIPVVATNVGGTSEIVNNQVGVLLSDNPFIDDVCSAFDKIHESRLDRHKIKAFWNEKSNAVTNYLQFYKDIQSL